MGLFSKKKSKSYEVNKEKFKCTVCQHDKFDQRSAQLNTSFASFLGADWLNTSAECLVCDKCGYIHWFLV